MAGTRSSGMHIRVNPEIKASVEPILEKLGLSFSDVFNLTLHQIALKRKIPFDISIEEITEHEYPPEFYARLDEITSEVDEAIANGTAKLYTSAAALFADIDAEDDDA